MSVTMITKRITELLMNREFISMGTCDFEGRPNVAPKLLLKMEGDFIYLADYVIGRTFENLKNNPKVSLAFMDVDNLAGYQINGSVEIINEGPFYEKIQNELSEKEIKLSVKRIIEGVGKGKKHKSFEVGFPQRAVIFKVKVEELVEIGSSGQLKREKL